MIRDARPDDDAAACAAIYAPSVDPGVASFELTPPDAGEMAVRIADAPAWVVVEEHEELLGFAYAGPFNARAAYRFAVNVSVYVAAVHHRRGLGRALYEELFARLRAQGIRWACAGITLPNAGSVGLHEALGFQPVGVYRQIGFKHGAWHDVGWWQLEL